MGACAKAGANVPGSCRLTRAPYLTGHQQVSTADSWPLCDPAKCFLDDLWKNAKSKPADVVTSFLREDALQECLEPYLLVEGVPKYCKRARKCHRVPSNHGRYYRLCRGTTDHCEALWRGHLDARIWPSWSFCARAMPRARSSTTSRRSTRNSMPRTEVQVPMNGLPKAFMMRIVWTGLFTPVEGVVLHIIAYRSQRKAD